MENKELAQIARELSKMNDKFDKIVNNLKINRDLILEEAREQIKKELPQIGSSGTYNQNPPSTK